MPLELLVAHDGRAAALVEADTHDAIEAVAHGIDVRDENDLREAVGQVTQQLHHGGAMVLIQRPEDLVEDQQ